MSDKSRIEWTDATWNPIRGCSVVSPGCVNCYAMKHAWRFNGPGQPYEGLTKMGAKGPIWIGKVSPVPKVFDQPIRWRKPRMVFVNSMSDLFHESVPDELIAAIFGIMAGSPRHTFQVLTKRPQRALEWFRWVGSHRGHDYTADPWLAITGAAPVMVGLSFHTVGPWPLPNVWLGVSVEDQQRADERVPVLLEIPAAVRWVSAEPLLGPVALDAVRSSGGVLFNSLKGVDWVVVGGESGVGARPMDVEWVRSIQAQCRGSRVPVFVKQLGRYAYQSPGKYGTGHELPLDHPKGGDWGEWPSDLRVRQLPGAGAAR